MGGSPGVSRATPPTTKTALNVNLRRGFLPAPMMGARSHHDAGEDSALLTTGDNARGWTWTRPSVRIGATLPAQWTAAKRL